MQVIFLWPLRSGLSGRSERRKSCKRKGTNSTASSLAKQRQMKEITFRVSDEMVALLEEWVKHIPEMEIVAQKESQDYGLGEMDRKMALALETLRQNNTIRRLYDYTWIMVAIGDGAIEGLGAFKSPQSFMDYLSSLGVEHIPSRTTLSTFYNKVLGTYPNWEFTDTDDPQEILRRKNVVRQLISALNKAKTQAPEQKAEQ